MNMTPGPWRVGEDFDGLDCIRSDAEIVARTAHSYIPGREEANGLLIAAAPELAEALKALLATSECPGCPERDPPQSVVDAWENAETAARAALEKAGLR